MKQLLLILFLINSSLCETFKVTDRVYFDISTDGKYLGRILIGLFGEVAPKTVANFRQIAGSGIDGKTYEGTRFHRVVRRFMIQGGDIIHNNGSGSISIYGKYFPDENFIVRHSTPGIVSMANGGPNTNGCQFFILTMQAPWLDGYHTAFGKVMKGQDVVHRIEQMKTDTDDQPLQEIKIIRSGVLKTTSALYESDDPFEFTFWAWIKAGWFPLSFSFAILAFFHWLMTRLDSCSTYIG